MSFPLPVFTKPPSSRIVRPPASFTASRGSLTPAGILALVPAAWFRYGVGITVTGAGVSQWDDQSGNGRHLKQGTDTNRPALQADNTILFDGADNFLVCDAFTLNQPTTVYILFKQVSWTIDDRIYDGNTLNAMGFRQDSATPQINIIAGATGPISTALAIGVYGVVSAVFNGASSVLQVNNNTPTVGNAGAGNAGGFTLGARGAGAGASASNVQAKEIIIFPVAHDGATRKKVTDYLTRYVGLS